jgi:hypothetical protein
VRAHVGGLVGDIVELDDGGVGGGGRGEDYVAEVVVVRECLIVAVPEAEFEVGGDGFVAGGGGAIGGVDAIKSGRVANANG